jgi:uncharacterized repeat protein (TIGR02543 family)
VSFNSFSYRLVSKFLPSVLLLSALVALPTVTSTERAEAAGEVLSQVTEPGYSYGGRANYGMYSLLAPTVGTWDLVGAWNFNNATREVTYPNYNSHCSGANNSDGNYGPVANTWGTGDTALRFNALAGYGHGVSNMVLRKRVDNSGTSNLDSGTDTGIRLSVSITGSSHNRGIPNTGGCVPVYEYTDYYGGIVNSNAPLRRSTRVEDGPTYIYPENYFVVSRSSNALWENTFSNLDPTVKYRFQFVLAANQYYDEEITSTGSLNNGAPVSITERNTVSDPEGAAGGYLAIKRNRITVTVSGYDTYTFTRKWLFRDDDGRSKGSVLNAFTIYQEAKTATTTTQSVSNTNPAVGDTVNLSATVSPNATGTVTFKDSSNNTLCTTNNLSSSTASCSWANSSAGVKTIRAIYSGSSSHATSTSLTTDVTWISVFVTTYNATTNGGTAISPLTSSFTEGETGLILPTPVARTGFTANGWYTAAVGGSKVGSAGASYTPTLTSTLYFQWIANTYTVTYDSNTGTGMMATQTITAGTPFELSVNTFEKLDYSFDGWYENSGSTGIRYSEGDLVTLYANKTYYAKWSPLPRTITYLTNGATGTAPIQNAKNEAETFLVASDTGLTRTGYDFAGWSDGTTTYRAGDTYTVPAANVTLSAQWIPQVYTVTYNGNSATSGSSSRASDSFTFGDSAIVLPIAGTLVRTGYTFAGWSVIADGTTISGSYTPNQSITLYAKWTADSHHVTYDLNGGTSTLPTQVDVVTDGTFVTAATPTRFNYKFDGWSNGTTTANAGATFAMGTTDLTLTAQWTAKTIPTFSWNDVTKTYGDASFSINAPTTSTPGTWSYSSGTTSVVTINNSTASIVGAGSSIITAAFTPDDTSNYASGGTISMTVNVNSKSQTITRTSTSPTSPIKFGTYTPTATASSLLSVAITIASDSSSICSIASGVVNFNAAGNCVIQYNQSGNFNYLAASQVTETLEIGKASPTFTWGGVSKNYGESAFDLVDPTPSTPGTWIYSSATPSVLSLSGATATIAGSGTSLITATFTPTDTDNYVSGGTSTMTVTVTKPTLSITASSHTVAFGDAVPTITPTYSGFVNGEDSSVVSGLTCSTTYTTTTAVGSATSSCTGATASNYSFAYTSGVITVTQGGQTSALVIDSIVVTYGSTLTLTTTGGNGLGSNSFLVNSGPCSVSGSTLSATAAGTCMVTATKDANGNYLASSSVSTAITVAKKNLTISGLTGVNKVFDGNLASTVTGTPTLLGVVGSDDVALIGTPTFAFATADVGNTKALTGSGYGLTNATASNYTLTQPVVIANVTQKAIHVAANNVTIAYGATVNSSFTTSGLVAPDSVTAVTYSYSGTGTTSAPTAVGIYSITPSLAAFGAGSSGNYSITYDPATLTILAKYTTTYNANGGVVSGGATSNVDFVVGDNALTLPTPTRANYTFTGWYTLQSNGVRVTGAYTPSATATLWAHWVQNSLYGMGASTKILTITTLAGVGNTYSANAAGGTIGIEYLADALPAGTIIDAYVLSDTSTATTLIGASNNYVMSLVLAWVALDGTVPTTAAGKAISMTITNSAIKKGAKVYSVIGENTTLVGTATIDGSATISITDDPQIIIAITKPDAVTGVSATSSENTSSTVSWTAPANDGGSAITSYTAISNAGQSCTTATTSCQVTGLTNGTSYTFTVTALNAIGVSDISTASVAITPSAPAPARVSVSVSVPIPTPAPTIVVTQAVVATPAPVVMPTITSLAFVENAAKTGGKLVWAGTNIESVLFTGAASTYPQPFNYGAFTLSWDGTLVEYDARSCLHNEVRS